MKVHPEGKYVVDIDKTIDITKLNANDRVALRNDSYTLHLVLPSKVDPLVSLMKVEKVPDSTYDMVGGCDKQIKEIKEVCMLTHIHPLGPPSPLGHMPSSTKGRRACQACSRLSSRPLTWPVPGIRSAACALSSSDLACPVRCLCSTQVIELPIKHPELFESLGIAQPKGVLMYGPPGTGKTLLARAVAHHTDCTFIRVSGGELVQKYIGEGSVRRESLF